MTKAILAGLLALLVVAGTGAAARADDLAAAVLPSSRSGVVNKPVTAFATLINVSGTDAAGCTITTSQPGLALDFQTTDPATNTPVGMPNTPVAIANGQAQSFLLNLTASVTMQAVDVKLTFDCTGLQAAPIISGLDTLLLSIGTIEPADIVALSLTQSRNGIISTGSNTGTGAFVVASIDVGAGAAITAMPNTGSMTALPVALTICQTDLAGACMAAPAASVAASYQSLGTATFAVFVTASGSVPFNPGMNRVFVTFTDSANVVRGRTSVALDVPGTQTFTASYQGAGVNSNNCNTADSISGVEPTGPGRFPVFIYMVGTTENFTNASALASINGMAAKGYVSATIQYNSATFGGCAQIQAKAECIFNPNSASSAVSALCGRAEADCSKGVVVGGFSQGAVMGTQSQNFNPSVKAVWGMGDGVMYTSGFNLTSCQGNGNRTLPSILLRAVNGQGDEFTGNTEALQQTNMQSLTGFICASGAITCLQSNGSGWIIVQNSQTEANNADHCYMRDGGCLASQDNLDTGWANGSASWELAANLNFLAGFAPGSN